MAWSEGWEFEFDTLPYKFNLECLADFQLGSRSTCLWKIKQHIGNILSSAKTIDTAVIIAGDIEDEDRPSTRELRYKMAADRPEVVSRDADKHMAWLDREVIPLLLKLHVGTSYGIIGGVAGHHWTQLNPALNSVQYIFNQLKLKSGKPCIYLGEMVSFLDFSFKHIPTGHRCRSVGLLQHGEGGGQTKNATVTKMERAVQSFDADFYIRGHDCQLIGTKTDQIFPAIIHGGVPGIRSRTKVLLNLGAATMGYELGKGPSSYIEKGMLRPATMGWGTIKFKVRSAHPDEDNNKNIRIDLKLEF